MPTRPENRTARGAPKRSADRRRRQLARYGAPAGFLAAMTVAVLLVRAGLEGGPSPGDRPASTAAVRPPSGTTTAEPVTEAATGPGQPGRRDYLVRSGDTLAQIAARFDTTVEELLELNPRIEPTALRVGQRVRVS